MKNSGFTMRACKECGFMGHSAMWHKRSPLKAYKPMRLESGRSKERRLTTRKKWFGANPPDKDGHWFCYISKHPSCPKILDEHTINLEHNLSKTRRPDLKHDITNIFPSCSFDNKNKGSLSAEEYMDAP